MNPVLSTQLGTRHRAGIGITEETDAIAVIVSEETGAISMAVGGKIDRDLTADQLRESLSKELRRYMAPVALPTAVPSDDSDAGLESPLRPRTTMSADGDADPEMERPL
jgi:diadenylate cyclase